MKLKDVNSAYYNAYNKSPHKVNPKVIVKDGTTETTISKDVIINEDENNVFYVSTPEDKKRWEIANRIDSIINIEFTNNSELYEISGFTMEGTDKPFSMSIPIGSEEQFANLAEEARKLLGINFPPMILSHATNGTQYQFIPGQDKQIPFPRLRKKSEDFRTYEDYLENFYSKYGINQEENRNLTFRKPYPHEHLKTQDGKIIFDESYTTESYNNKLQQAINEKAQSQGITKNGPRPSNTDTGATILTKVDMPENFLDTVKRKTTNLYDSTRAYLSAPTYKYIIKTVAVAGVAVGTLALFGAGASTYLTVAAMSGIIFSSAKLGKILREKRNDYKARKAREKTKAIEKAQEAKEARKKAREKSQQEQLEQQKQQEQQEQPLRPSAEPTHTEPPKSPTTPAHTEPPISSGDPAFTGDSEPQPVGNIIEDSGLKDAIENLRTLVSATTIIRDKIVELDTNTAEALNMTEEQRASMLTELINQYQESTSLIKESINGLEGCYGTVISAVNAREKAKKSSKTK